MKKSAIFCLFLFSSFYFLVSSAFAAEQTYLLTFQNSPTAGPALNVRFIFNIPAEIAAVNLKPTQSFQDSVLTINGPNIIAPGEIWQDTITLSGPEEILSEFGKTEAEFSWQDDNFSGSGKTFFQKTNPESLINKIRSNPTLVKQLKNIGVPLAIGLGGVGIISLGTNALSVSATFTFNLAEFFRYFAFGFLRFKKRKPWGTVSDQITGNPVPRALVRIFDARLKKAKETQITDPEGRFGFLVSPGEYYVTALRQGFEKEQSKIIKISKPGEAIELNLILKPASLAKRRSFGFLRLFNWLKKFIDLINPYLLALGTILSLMVLIILPSIFNYVVFAIYLLLDILKIFLSKHAIKSFGTISSQANRPLDLAVVRIFDAEKSWLISTKVTDVGGKFNFLTMPGNYYLTAARTGYEEYHSNAMEVKKSGIVNLDIKLAGEK